MNAVLKTRGSCRNAYRLAVFAALLLSAFSLTRFFFESSSMEDLGMMCAAVKAELHGESPYILSHLQKYSQTVHSFPYPPLALLPLKPLCAGNPYFIYPVICLTAVLGLCVWIGGSMPRDRWLLLALLLSGFEGTYFLLRTGNIEVVNFLLFGALMGFLARNKIGTAGAVLGAAAFLKILPLFFAAIFLIGKENRKEKIFAAALAAVVFFSAHIVSFLIYGDWYPGYFQLLTGQSDGHVPLKETFYAGWTHPSFLTLTSLFGRKIALGGDLGFTGLLYAVLVFAVISGFYFFLKKPRSFTSVFSYGVLLMLLMMPRLKPYTFCLVVVPVYFLSRQLNDFRKTILTSAAVFFPYLCRVFAPLSIVLEYGQLYSLMLVCGMFFVWRKEID